MVLHTCEGDNIVTFSPFALNSSHSEPAVLKPMQHPIKKVTKLFAAGTLGEQGPHWVINPGGSLGTCRLRGDYPTPACARPEATGRVSHD